MEFWNSIDQLSKLNNYLQVALVSFGILTGIIGATSFALSHRKTILEAKANSQFKKKVETIDERTDDVRQLKKRNLSEEQIEFLKNRLQGTGKIKVLAIRHISKESQGYSIQIEKVFESVGWTFEQLLPTSDLRKVSPPRIGRNSKIPNSNAFDALKKALKELGLPFLAGEFEYNVEFEISLDAGVIPANEFQAIIDKIN